jgi:hypothetical protein
MEKFQRLLPADVISPMGLCTIFTAAKLRKPLCPENLEQAKANARYSK